MPKDPYSNSSTPTRRGTVPLGDWTNMATRVNGNSVRVNNNGEIPHSYDSRHHRWGPGDVHEGTLLSDRQCQLLFQEDTSGTLFSDLFKRIEDKMDSNFEKFEKKLDDIERRVADIESAGYQLSDVTSSSSSSDSTSGTRKKRSPPDLQFKIRAVHSSFNECNQLHCHERIDSEHNRKVVVSVIKELSEGCGYSPQQIRDGCRIYRKTLHEKEKEKSLDDTRKTRIRSRQQRLFDWRKKVASPSRSKKVKKLWDGITPDMMTEEESEEEKGFVRHRQSWRSDVFNRFMDKLDSSRNQKTLAKPCELGEQVERMPPICVKKWMMEGSMENSIEDNEFSDTTDD